jgi:hypothetical protein
MAHKHAPNFLQLVENASPATPAASHVAIYPKTDGLFYQKDDAGVERILGNRIQTQDEFAQESILLASILNFPRGSVSSPGAGQALVLPSINSRRRQTSSEPAANSSILPFGFSCAIGGTLAASIQTDSYYVSCTTAAVLNDQGGPTSTSLAQSAAAWNQNPVFECVMRTGATIANTRQWIGMAENTPNNNDTLTVPGLLFRYNGTGWTPCAFDGVTQTTGTAIGTVAVSTRYFLRIRVVGTTAYFSVNGSAEQTISSNVPTSTTNRMGLQCVVLNTAAAARAILYSRASIESN